MHLRDIIKNRSHKLGLADVATDVKIHELHLQLFKPKLGIDKDGKYFGITIHTQVK